MAIKDWHEDDRPREKLLKFGASQLTDAEILAIFLRTGNKQLSAIELARSLIEQFGSLAALVAAPKHTVLACNGIGTAKYAQIMASLEMGKRYLKSELATTGVFNRTQLVKDYLSTQFKHEQREVFAVLCLDAKLTLIHYEVLFVGGIESCEVCIRHVLRHALHHNASHLIIAHNHLHANATPSHEDNTLTKALYQACQLVAIQLVDHMIVAQSQVLSYAENGYSPFCT